MARNSVVTLVVLAALYLLAGVGSAGAATITVTNTNDSGPGSLRQAITDANGSGSSTISFSVSGTITLLSALPAISNTGVLTIEGAGQDVTISGNSSVSVFTVAAEHSLALNNLTIANGSGGSGAGVANYGSLTVANCTFSGNAATGMGGGIYNDWETTITGSTFSGNSAQAGGGVYNIGTLTISNSTFTGNGSIGSGGVIYNSTGAAVTVTNSTFAGNRTSSQGDVIYSYPGGSATFRNSILSRGQSTGCCGGPIINGGNNIDDGVSCGWGSANGSMSSTNPLLGALADNGGPTQTMALLPGSPAIDGVTYNSPNGAPAADQRGVSRPQGARDDIGAYEYQGQAVASVPAMNEWGLITFVLCAGIAAVTSIKRKRRS